MIVQKLQAQGVRKVGDFDVEQLAQQISSTKWQVVQGKFLIGSGKDRVTSIYLPESQQVIVNDLALQFIEPATVPLAALHEALGAHGYEDENYQLSLSLQQLSLGRRHGADVFQNVLKESSSRKLQNKVYLSADGGTSVGGGGDGTALEFKSLLLETMLKALNSSQPSDLFNQKVLQLVLNAEVESDWVFKGNSPSAAQIDFTSENGRTVIRIPSVMWVMMSKTPEADLWKQTLVISALEKILAEIR